MSEEKPTFRVRDRRLFNPDGTPREIEREEEKSPAPSGDTTGGAADASPATARPSAADASATSGAAHEQRGDADASRTADASPTGADRGSKERGERGAQHAGAEADPTAFANLVMFIASPAAAALGLSEHPEMQPGEVDLPLARHCIELLVTLREKARGNLSQREQQIIEGILAELQMQYVSLTSPPRPAPPRGFTGGDITGGR